MRIEILTQDDAITDNLRVYSEYRLFSAIGAHAPRIESITVHVRTGATEAPGAGATCVVIARLLPAGSVRTTCAASHPAAAIDGAITRVAGVIAARLSRNDSGPGRAPAR